MTLLVLSLKIPNIPYPSIDTQILNSLLLMGHQFLIYFISFFLLASFWRVNHAQFYFIKKTDQALLWINIAWLSFIALIPILTNLIGIYGYIKVPLIIFDLNIFFISFLFNLNCYYADKKELIDLDADRNMIRFRENIISLSHNCNGH